MDHGATTVRPPPALVIRNLSKTFGGERALDRAALTVLAGECHGLLGENGSGKSTLIKILAGYHAPEPGAELEIHGQPVRLPLAPGQFREFGVSFVHQDLGLIPSLTVLENLLVGQWATRRDWRISWAREHRRARELFGHYGVELDPDARVADLRPVERALLAIVRAAHEVSASDMVNHRGLLVLDEPTVFLPRADIERLFRLVRDIVDQGASVLFVSHDLDEVREITSRVTVLRDGRAYSTVLTNQTSRDDLIEMIVGRRLDAFAGEHADRPAGPVALSIERLAGGAIDEISFDVYEGEVLGLTGILGSGFDELPYLLFGVAPAYGGAVRIGRTRHDAASLRPDQSLASGLALIPADRQREGIIGSLSVADNVTMQVLGSLFINFLLRQRRILSESTEMLERFGVRPNDPGLLYSSLSGGNQQKALLAKWLRTRPQVLLLHEPTQGVDVGARQEIFSMIRDCARAGTTILCASSDHEQLAAICDRVLIFSRGQIAHQLVGADLTKERIAERSYAA